jgi:fido (protein-threonine AMPylation protein)
MADDDPYVYPGTSVLRNHFGIRDAAELAEREAAHTAIRIAELERRFIPGDYDTVHLQAVHRKIFGHLDWTGLDPDRNIEASRESHRGDNEPLKKLLDGLIAD